MPRTVNDSNLTVSYNESEGCYVPTSHTLHIQVYYVGIVGGSLGVVGIVQNMLLLYLFSSRPFFRRSSFFYLTLLAAIDLLHCFNYLLVFWTIVFVEWHGGLDWLSSIWFQYVIPLTVLDYILLSLSSYLLVIASLERYLSANWLYGVCSNFSKIASITAILLLVSAVNGPISLELEVLYFPFCPPGQQYILQQTDLVLNPVYQQIWGFWVRNLINIFLPFLLLFSLNVGIIIPRFGPARPPRASQPFAERFRQIVFRVQSSGDTISNKIIVQKTTLWAKRARARVRKSATTTLIAIVCEYLISHGLAVSLAGWEIFDRKSLENRPTFYSLANDTISILTVITTVIRLPIYWICCGTFRTELSNHFCGKRTRDLGAQTTSSFSEVVSRLIEKKKNNNNQFYSSPILTPSASYMVAKRPYDSMRSSYVGGSGSLRTGRNSGKRTSFRAQFSLDLEKGSESKPQLQNEGILPNCLIRVEKETA